MEQKQFFTVMVKANKSTGTFSFIASTNAIDRQGEVIDPAGWELKRFMDNPVILWAHNYSELPIGKAIKTYVDERGLIVDGVFASAEANPKAQQVRTLYEEGMLTAVSVGFIPLERNGSLITKSELLEISFVPVPANPEALSLMKRTMQLEASLMKSIEDASDEYHPEDEGTITPPEDEDVSDDILEEEIADTLIDEEEKKVEGDVKEGRVLSAKNVQKIASIVGAMKDLSSALEELLSSVDAPKASDDSIVKADYVVISRVTLDEVRTQLRSVDKHNELHLAVLNRALGK